jgi:hypothetical protein
MEGGGSADVGACAGGEAVERAGRAAGRDPGDDITAGLPAAWAGQYAGVPPLPAGASLWRRGLDREPLQHRGCRSARPRQLHARAVTWR